MLRYRDKPHEIRTDSHLSFALSAASAFNGSGAFILSSSMTIAAAGSLTLPAGVIVKADFATNPNPTLFVFGPLTCNGTSAQPVVFTSV